MQHFTSLSDVDDLHGLVAQAAKYKSSPRNDETLGYNKTLGLIFFNPSLRTRLSTQIAGRNLGMEVIVMNIGKEGWQLELGDGAIMDGGKAEHIKDAAAVMGSYCDIIGVRTFATLEDKNADYDEQVLRAFQKYAGVPIVSLESATRHPLQSLADVLTIMEHKKVERPKVVLSWAPHPKALPQAVANSFSEWVKATECDFVITHPEGMDLAAEFFSGVEVNYDQKSALKDADFVYVKNWASYRDYGKVLQTANDWTLTADKMALTNQAYFMHCLPVRRNVVVTDEVIDSQQSLVTPLAENRIYSAQAVLADLLKSRQNPS